MLGGKKEIKNNTHNIPTDSDDYQSDKRSFNDFEGICKCLSIVVGREHLVKPIHEHDQRNKTDNSEKPVDKLLYIVGSSLIFCLRIIDS